MGFAKSGTSIYNRRKWQRQLEERREGPSRAQGTAGYGRPDTGDDYCGHVWEWDPEDRMMRCYKCGGVRLPTDADKIGPSRAQDARRDNAADTGLIIRMENGDTDF